MTRLGQHFLKDGNTIEKIATSCEDAPYIIEIGPGHGELTRVLQKTYPTAKLICLERDRALVDQLLTTLKDISIIQGNALETIQQAVKDIGDAPYIIVGNIPYYITGHLFRVIGSLKHKPKSTTLLIQKEVAERLTSVAPRMNRLAASVLFWGTPQLLFPVGRHQFSPPPKVESAVIQIKTAPHNKKPLLSQNRIDSILAGAFHQPRKTILNNIANAKPNISREKISHELKSLGIDPSMRPQSLTLEDLKMFGKFFK